mgnify:CR=1 FL=1
MTVAVAGAWIIGEHGEAAAVVFLFSLSELLESWAATRARRAVQALLELSPTTAIVIGEDGTEREIAVAEVAIGTEIRVRSGSRVPLDGEVISGNSSVDQAPITGESVPVEKAEGNPVFAGTVNQEGSLTVRVTKAANASTLARRGVLVKGGIYLEAVGKLRALAVDKTGTITQGKPQVVGITPVGDLTDEEILRRAAAINTHSEHPLATAIGAAARSRKVPFESAPDYVSITGQGAQATVDGHPHFIGNHKMAHEAGVCSPEIEAILSGIESQGQSLAVVGHLPHGDCKGEVLGIIAIADTLRIIRFNVTFALAIKALFLVLAFLGIAGLWLAILADTGATLLVILNSLRLLARPQSYAWPRGNGITRIKQGIRDLLKPEVLTHHTLDIETPGEPCARSDGSLASRSPSPSSSPPTRCGCSHGVRILKGENFRGFPTIPVYYNMVALILVQKPPTNRTP